MAGGASCCCCCTRECILSFVFFSLIILNGINLATHQRENMLWYKLTKLKTTTTTTTTFQASLSSQHQHQQKLRLSSFLIKEQQPATAAATAADVARPPPPGDENDDDDDDDDDHQQKQAQAPLPAAKVEYDNDDKEEQQLIIKNNNKNEHKEPESETEQSLENTINNQNSNVSSSMEETANTTRITTTISNSTCFIHIGKAGGSMIGCVLGYETDVCRHGSNTFQQYKTYRSQSLLAKAMKHGGHVHMDYIRCKNMKQQKQQQQKQNNTNKNDNNDQFQIRKNSFLIPVRNPITRIHSWFKYEYQLLLDYVSGTSSFQQQQQQQPTNNNKKKKKKKKKKSSSSSADADDVDEEQRRQEQEQEQEQEQQQQQQQLHQYRIQYINASMIPPPKRTEDNDINWQKAWIKRFLYFDCYNDFITLVRDGLMTTTMDMNNNNMMMNNNSVEIIESGDVRNMTCKQRAWAAITGSRGFHRHNWYNYEYYYDVITNYMNTTTSNKNNDDDDDSQMNVYVLRNEHLIEDWNQLHEIFDTTTPSGFNDSSASSLLYSGEQLFSNRLRATSTTEELPSDIYPALCHALCIDIQYYKRILYMSTNLDYETQIIQQSMNELRQYCPKETNHIRSTIDCPTVPIFPLQDRNDLFVGKGKPRYKIQ